MTRRRRTKAQEWRPEEAPSDSAPAWQPDRPSVAEWGVTQEEARDLLRRLMCPACGQGPWHSPLGHAAKKHGIDRFTMRDICGLTTTEIVAHPDLSARRSELSKAADMTKVTEASMSRKKQRWTSAGRARNADTLAAWETDNPDAAIAARSAAGKRGAAARWDRRP